MPPPFFESEGGIAAAIAQAPTQPIGSVPSLGRSAINGMPPAPSAPQGAIMPPPDIAPPPAPQAQVSYAQPTYMQAMPPAAQQPWQGAAPVAPVQLSTPPMQPAPPPYTDHAAPQQEMQQQAAPLPESYPVYGQPPVQQMQQPPMHYAPQPQQYAPPPAVQPTPMAPPTQTSDKESSFWSNFFDSDKTTPQGNYPVLGDTPPAPQQPAEPYTYQVQQMQQSAENLNGGYAPQPYSGETYQPLPPGYTPPINNQPPELPPTDMSADMGMMAPPPAQDAYAPAPYEPASYESAQQPYPPEAYQPPVMSDYSYTPPSASEAMAPPAPQAYIPEPYIPDAPYDYGNAGGNGGQAAPQAYTPPAANSNNFQSRYSKRRTQERKSLPY